MSSCRRIRSQLPGFLAGEIAAEERRPVSEHLAGCASCRLELEALTLAAEKGRQLANAAEQAIAAIDWDAVPARILERLEHRERAAAPVRPLFRPAWRPALALASLLAAAVLLWIVIPGKRTPASPPIVVTAGTLDRLQTSLSRDQLLQYLDQSRMVLAGMLDQCQDAPPAAGELASQSQRIRTLLQKKKFLQEDFSRLELAKAEPVCRQINLLFYEIMQLTPDNTCGDIGRIQKMIKKDNLLMKIRLLERDLTFTGEKEA